MAIVAGKFKIEQEIGRGAYATVYSATLVQPYPPLDAGASVAIKSISTSRISSSTEKEKLENEISLMMSLDHPNIVKLYGVERLHSYYFLVMEFCNEGDLIHYIHNFGSSISEETVSDFAAQIGQGLKYLHKNQIIHRDLKPHNILLSKGDNGKMVLKIADFGFARFLRPSDLAETICGSPVYMAPEIQFGTHYSSKVDMWSLGVILYELVTQKTPFPNIKSQYELAQELKNRGSNPFTIPVSSQASPELRDVIKHLLTIDPEKRMSLYEFLHSPFILNAKETIKSQSNDSIQEIETKKEEEEEEKNEEKENELDNQKKRSFSFLMSDGSIESNRAAKILSDALESSNVIIKHIPSESHKADIITITCAFLLDFLHEYKLISMGSPDYDEDLECKVIEFVDQTLEQPDNLEPKNEDKELSSTQILFNKGLEYARFGAESEKRAGNIQSSNLEDSQISSSNVAPLSLALFQYRKAISLLMPLAYQISDDENTAKIRELFRQITIRSEMIERKLEK